MRLRTCEALLLEISDLHDSDRIVSFVTAEYGRKRGVAKGARRKFSRFAGLLQPLARVRVRWFEKDGLELVRVQEIDSVRSTAALLRDLEGILTASYLAEHVAVLAQEDEPSPLYFRLLDSTVVALCAGADRDLATRFFEIWALRLAGVLPAAHECAACGSELADEAALPRDGEGLWCVRCAAGSGRVVDREALGFLRRTLRETLGALERSPPAPATLRALEQVCGEVRRNFLGHELRSYGVLCRTLREVS